MKVQGKVTILLYGFPNNTNNLNKDISYDILASLTNHSYIDHYIGETFKFEGTGWSQIYHQSSNYFSAKVKPFRRECPPHFKISIL